MRRATQTLLRYYAAGDAVAGVTSGIGLHVVGFRVDNDRGAAVAEKRMRAVAEGHVFVFHGGIGFAFHVNREVRHVAGVMAFGVVETVLLAVGIEMRAGGFEVWRIALGILMEVDGVLAGRQIVKMKLEGNTGSLLRESDRADGFALGVCEFDLLGFGRAAGKCENEQSNSHR